MSTRVGEVSAEARDTGGRAAQVRESSETLAHLVADMKQSLVRVVRAACSLDAA